MGEKFSQNRTGLFGIPGNLKDPVYQGSRGSVKKTSFDNLPIILLTTNLN
jgi:hypothetical protein